MLEQTLETLIIRRRNEKGTDVNLQNLDNRVEILIRTPYLNAVKLSGSSKARINNFKANNMEVRLTGVSDAVIHSEINTLDADLGGASRLKLEGHGNTVRLKASGTSHINGSEFEATKAFIRTEGGATASINATEIIDALAE